MSAKSTWSVSRCRFSSCSSRPRCRSTRTICKAGRTCYDVLGVEPDATDDVIKKAFRRMALKLHPDVNKEAQAQEEFMHVKNAYETLSDAQRRAQYDQQLQQGDWESYSFHSSSPHSGMGGAETWEVVMDDDIFSWFLGVEADNGTSQQKGGSRGRSSSSSRQGRSGRRSATGGGAGSGSNSSSRDRFESEAAAAGYRYRTRGGGEASGSGRGGEGRGRKSGGKKRAVEVSAFEVFLEELDDDDREALAQQVMELHPEDQEAVLRELEAAQSVQEVMYILNEMVLDPQPAPSHSGFMDMMDILEIMDDGSMWHKNAGVKGGSRAARGVSVEEVLDLEDLEEAFAGYHSSRSSAGGAKRKATGRQAAANRGRSGGARSGRQHTTGLSSQTLFDLGVDDIGLMGDQELQELVTWTGTGSRAH